MHASRRGHAPTFAALLLALGACAVSSAPDATQNPAPAAEPSSPEPTPLVEVRVPPSASSACVGPACPQLLAIDEGLLQLPEPIRYELESATINPESTPILDLVAATIASEPELCWTIEGHTHSQIPAIARSRVKHSWMNLLMAVRTTLVEQGVDERSVSVRFMSDHEPIASNASAEGREQNTRIAFRAATCN